MSLLILAALDGSGCGRQPSGPENVLTPPILLPVPFDLAENEAGLDAVPEKDAIQVQWGPYPMSDATIVVHRLKEGEKDFVVVARVPSRDSLYLDESVAIGVRYWYFLRAVAGSGEKSGPSDTLSYKLLEKPFALTESASRRPVFRWQAREVPVAYVLKLFDALSDKKVWFAVVPPNYGSFAEEVRFNFDGTAAVDSLVPGHTYRWRVDIIAPELNAGAESEWRTFICP